MSGSALTIAPQDRLMRALRGIIRQQLARYTHMGTYEYSVSSSDGTTVDMKPTDTTISLPGLQGIPLRLCGMTAKPATGQLVLLSFINGDPTRPAVVNTNPIPTLLAIDATSTVTIGASSTTVNIGHAPAPLALAGAVQNALTAINGALGDISAYAVAIKAVADPSNAGTSTLTSGMTYEQSQITLASNALATTVLKGT